MPITVNELVEKVGLNPKKIKKVEWGIPVDTQMEGVYIVSLSSDPDENITMKRPRLNIDLLKEWIEKREYFILDGIKCYANDIFSISNRLSKFWLHDENILYIGKASNLHDRIGALYRHKVGKRSPHAGGHWIKLLSNLHNLYLYYIECPNSEKIEKNMMTIFGLSVSEESKKQLSGTSVILPFANLEDGNKIRKKHGLGHMKK